jgi:hypothetical protein
MPKAPTAPFQAAVPEPHISAKTNGKKSACIPSAPNPIPEFDAALYRKEIAQVAYRIWLERADRPGSPEEDWVKAESEIRAKYTR